VKNPDDPRNEESSDNRPRWPRTVGWIFASLAALLLIVAVSVTIILRNPNFHEYILKLAENKASQALGTPVKLQNFAIHLSNLNLDIYGVSIDGANPYSNPPLLLIRHAEIGVRVISVLGRKWYLDNVQVDDPVVRVYVDANGVSNIPRPKSGSGNTHLDVFDLGVRHAVLSRGQLYYNDRKSVLEADLHDLNFRSSFDTPLQKYSGTLSYRNGYFQTSGFNPVSHNLDVQFDATRDTFHVAQAKIASGSSQFMLTATLRNYSQPAIRGTYDAMLDGADMRRILRNPSIPAGLIRATGTVAYRYDPKVALLNAVVLNGNFNSRRLNVQLSNLRAQVNDVAGQYALSNGNLAVRNFRARLLGGSLNATLDMRNLTGASQSKLTATLRRISLADLKRMAPANATSRELTLGGTMDANANASWGKNLDSLIARTDATIHASVSRAANVVPVQGSIHGTYFAATRQIALAHSDLRTPQTALTMDGTLGNRSGLALDLQSQNIAELETIADLFGASPSEPLGLAGTASFQGAVRGTTAQPQLSGQLTVEDLQIRGTKWRQLRTQVAASPSLVSLQHGDLQPAANGRITFNGSARLVHGSFTEESPSQLELHAAQIDLGDLEKIAGRQLPITGTLAANVNAHGTVLDPMGAGIVNLTHASAYGEPIPSANLAFTGVENQVHARLQVHVASGMVQGAVSLRPGQKSYVAQLTASGIHLDQLTALQTHNIDLQGQLSAHANGQGTFANPQLDATLQIPQLEIQQQKIHAIALNIHVADHIATANLDSQALNTSLQAKAKVNLTGDYLADASINTGPIALQPLLAVYTPSQAAGAAGETEIHATLHGPLKDKNLLQAQAVLPMLKLSYGSTIHLAAASPIHIAYKNGTINLERAAIRGTGTDLEIQGSIPMTRHAPASLLLLGTVDLQLAQLFNPDIKSSGQLKFNINSYGARTDPNVQGQVEIVNASFSNPDLPLGVQRGNGVLTLTKDRLNIQSFKATVGGGTLTGQGGIAYRPSIQFDLGASAQGIRMLYPQGVREEVDADLRLTGASDNALLGGRVRIQNMSFTPSFDLTNFVSQLSGGVAPPPSQGFSQNLRLNLSVSSTNNLNLVSRALSVDGAANLQVRGTAAQPVILGRINLTDGDIIFNGKRFTLAGGTVEFVNPSQTQPVVNLSLNTTIQQYNIALRFNGPVDQLRTNYSSDPSLPAADIINLLAFGQTTEASAANPTPGDQAAMSAVASQVSSQITSRVAKVAGISQLSINPVLAGGTTAGPAGAVITVQQRVTGNFFVTFSSNVTSSQSQVIMGQYQLSPRVAVSATRNQNGGFAFDTTFKKTW